MDLIGVQNIAFIVLKKDTNKNVTGIKFDYSEDDLSVYFEVADKKLAEEILLDISYIKNSWAL